MNRLDWLIIGGGVHGVHLAARLVGETRVDAARIAILDPAPRLLDRWRTFSKATGMLHLRSPGVHHLDLEPASLKRFAGDRRSRPFDLFRGRYDRPSLDLFNRHCAYVIERFGLAECHHRGKARRIQPVRGGVRVAKADGEELEARRVVLAIGAGEQPAWPSWAPRDEPRVRHIFGTLRNDSEASNTGRMTVVGGGISAAQLALRFVSSGWKVDLVTRHRFRVHRFDSDPGWLGPKRMPEFRAKRCPNQRRLLIQEARYRGSVTPGIRQALRAAAAKRSLEIHEESVSSLHVDHGHLRLELASGGVVETDHIQLATGFAACRPGGPMIDQLVEELALPCAACGYPVVDRGLRWHRRIHVTGPLAELELSPVARNIAGARRAGDRLVQVRPDRRRRASSKGLGFQASMPPKPRRGQPHTTATAHT